MWLIDWIPTSLLLAVSDKVVFLGVLIWLTGKLLPLLKLKQYSLITEIVGLLIVIIFTFLHAVSITDNKWEKRDQAIKEVVVEIIKEVPVINNKVETKVVEKIEYITIETEVVRTEIQKVKEYINLECRIDPKAVELYNQAVEDPFKIDNNEK